MTMVRFIRTWHWLAGHPMIETDWGWEIECRCDVRGAWLGF